jgi:hypothetical protein
MALNVWQRSITDRNGVVRPGASVEVRDALTGVLVQLYEDIDGEDALGNPFDADEEGFARFYVRTGRYRITATYDSDSRVWENERLGVTGEEVANLRTMQEVTAGVTPSAYEIPAHRISTHILAERYGCSASATASQNYDAIMEAFDVLTVLGGGYVQLPTGQIEVSDKIVIPKLPNGAGIRGCGPAATSIKASNSFSATAIIENEDTTGLQEYAFVESLYLNGNKGGGATITVAALNLVSLFVNSYVRDVIINNAPTVGMRIWAEDGGGPVVVENSWIVNSDQDNIVLGAEATSSHVCANYILSHVTSEHQGAGYSAIKIDGRGRVVGVKLNDIHIEQKNYGANTYALWVSGASDVIVDLMAVQSVGPGNADADSGSILIVNDSYAGSNVRHVYRNITNINTVNPLLVDAINGISFTGGLHLPEYKMRSANGLNNWEGVQVLTYGTTVNTDCTRGNYCQLVVDDTTAFTIANPTNAQPGQWLTYEITNAAGSDHGDITWGGDFDYMDSSVPTSSNKIANGRRRTITFRYRQANSWALVAATDDL